MDPLANPAASQPAPDRPVRESPYWAEGSSLVVRRGATLPERCVLCNEPAVCHVRKRFRWHSPWQYLLILGGLLLYLIAVLFITREMLLSVPLCVRHAKRYHSGIWLQFGALIVIAPGFLALIFLETNESIFDFGPASALAVMVLAALGVVVVGHFMTKTIKVRRITGTHGHFTAGAAFLNSCPDHWWDADEEPRDSDDRPPA